MSAAKTATVPAEHRADVEILWSYHQMHHDMRPCDVGVGLGSHDLGVAIFTARLYRRGIIGRIVFTGANAPTTINRFPRGEAIHYREHALELGVPDSAILVEPNATNTGENIRFTRALLAEHDISAESAVLVSKPYQQRRAYATCRKLWPEIDVICASRPLSLDDYVAGIGEPERVINMLVGDTQRITRYAQRGFAIPQDIPAEVHDAYQRLVDAGFTERLLAEGGAGR